jgi:hypothetical protein
VSADLDALDRGVIEAGLTAAAAVARVEALEAEVEQLRKQLVRVYRLGLEHARTIDRAAPLLAEQMERQLQSRHLSAVPPTGGQQ